jgi:hypothetical protein
MKSRFSTVIGSILMAFLAFGFAGSAPAQDAPNPAEPQDPPGRVGRLSFIEGAVQQRSAGDADFTRANLNYPVTNGFAVATQDGGRAEIQVGSMAVRIGSDSELDINAIGDHTTTLTLARGEINLSLAQLSDGNQVEILTPRGVANIVSAGHYHFDAGSTERPTQAAVFSGRLEVPRDGGPSILTDGQAALINSDEPSGLTLAASSRDPLDDWAIARDRGRNATAAARTVSPEMTGGGDLDQYGSWRHDQRYGEVWRPSDLPADWAPYRYGRWAWEPPWGWTWIDDAPWGFAPFHYGRWVYTVYGWEWVPGGYADYPVYAPALVGWVGGGPWVGPWVGWFPLAPFEVFVPSFFVSIDFVRRINITNVNITNINIIRANGNVVVNNTTNVTINNFANRQFVTTVSTTSFTSGQPVSQTMLTQSTTTHIASTTPVSWAPTNVAAPRTAAAASGWRGKDAAVRPPLPTANGGSAAAAKTVGGAGTIASATRGRDPQHGQGSLTSLPDTGATGNSVTAAGHKLPPLPSERPRSASSAVNTGTLSHPISPQANSGRTAWAGSPMVNANRGRPPRPSTVTPSMHAPTTSFAPPRGPTAGPMMPRGPSMMPRGPSMGAAPRPASPPMQSMGFTQHRGG